MPSKRELADRAVKAASRFPWDKANRIAIRWAMWMARRDPDDTAAINFLAKKRSIPK